MPTPIEWCDETFNPWWGCERVSPGCAHCYADTFAKRLGMQLWPANDSVSMHAFRFFGDGHWAEPLKWARTLPAKLGRRPRIFCASMADVFEERDELHRPRVRLFDLIEETPELDWLILTKRPEFARDWLAEHWPTPQLGLNVWLGVSIENSRFTWRADVLREIPAAVRFISAEPLLGSLLHDDRPVVVRGPAPQCLPLGLIGRQPLDLTGIDWVIVGGESGPGARPFHLEHAREIVRAARTLRYGDIGPAVFVKQLGAKPVLGAWSSADPIEQVGALKLRDRKGGDADEWPADLRVREFPRAAVPT